MNSDPGVATKNFLDVPVAAVTRDQAVNRVLSGIRGGTANTYRLVNAGTLSAAAHDPDYWNLLLGPGLNFPDGRPLASVLKRTPPTDIQCDQVRGLTLFELCLDRGRPAGVKHFLLGTTDETLKSLTASIVSAFPGASIAGTYSPPFGTRSRAEISTQDEVVKQSGADIVWVALGTPKQDAEALRIFLSTGISTVAVGAAFDFLAGTKRDAPAWMQRVHLEWFFRLASEPRRLGRRYLIGNVRFIRMVLQHTRR